MYTRPRMCQCVLVRISPARVCVGGMVYYTRSCVHMCVWINFEWRRRRVHVICCWICTNTLAGKQTGYEHTRKKKNNINAGSVLCLSTRKQLRRNTPPSTPHHRYPIGLIWTPPQKDDVRRVCVCSLCH